MPSWFVYIDNFNEKKIETFNIFEHSRFLDGCKKIAKKYKDDKAAFAEELRRELMYYFWSKCEWEIILKDWPSHDDFNDEKIDVYDQVRLNWNIFVDYVWENRKELTKRTRKTNKGCDVRGVQT